MTDPDALTDALADPRDPLPLARALIRCRSVTPADGGAQALLAEVLSRLGFAVQHLPFGPDGVQTPNLFARIGDGQPHLCFGGHTDVVPPGHAAWRTAPFEATVEDGILYGRGACDMKGAIAAFVAAVARHLQDGPLRGSISLLITGDEEGPATHGTVQVLDWLAERGEIPDFCLVGEPTNAERIGETIKIGRRGSLNARIVVDGMQGHVAYPHRAVNPVHRLIPLLDELAGLRLDAGSEAFEPSSLQVTSIDVGNPASNVIPGRAEARLNIRFNDRHTGESLSALLREACARHTPGAAIEIAISGESFLTEPCAEIQALRAAIVARSGIEPRLDTGGGTSDARFIARHCAVAEFGLVGRTMHQADEAVSVADLALLTDIYADLLPRLLAGQPGGAVTA